MDLDDQLRHYFGTDDPATLTQSGLEAGIERMRVEFGLAPDDDDNRGRRFALWTLMYLFNSAPDLDVAFSDNADRDAARDFMDMMAKAQGS